LSSISNKYFSIWKYNSKSDQWLWHFTGAEAFLNNMTHIEPGYGYWLNIKEDCIWDYGQSVLTSPVVSNEKPPFILYGKVSSDSPELLDGANISLKVGTIKAGNYILGSNPYYQEYYVIEVPVDTLFYEGDKASLLFNGMSFQDNTVILGGMGTLGKHHINLALKPQESRLFQNYPNPFNPETWIPFQLTEGAIVKISIYNSSGKLIKTLDLGFRTSGYYLSKDRSAKWDGRDENGEESSSGVYFYTIQAGKYIENGKMILTR